MIRTLAFLGLTVLAACGASGPPAPVAPTPDREPGIEISGTAEIGITGRTF